MHTMHDVHPFGLKSTLTESSLEGGVGLHLHGCVFFLKQPWELI